MTGTGKRAIVAAFGVLVALLGVGAAQVWAQGETFGDWWAYYAVYALASALVLTRAIAVRRARLAWMAVGAGMALYTAGSAFSAAVVYFGAAGFGSGVLPVPSAADALWLSLYPLAYLGLGLLLRLRVRDVPRSLWLDGVIGAMAVAALLTAVVFGAVVDRAHGARAEVVVSLAYPLADALLLACSAAALALSGWRFDRQWALFVAGMVVFALGDSIYLYLEATDRYGLASPVDMAWPVAFVLFAAAAWQLRADPTPVEPNRRSVLLAPVGFGLMGTGVLVAGGVAGLEPLAAGLGGATLGAVLARLALTFRENLALLEGTQVESVTDALTGLGNRRRLLADLQRRLADPACPPAALGLFDLNGFKAYNDTFGHATGDALLARLGRALERAVSAHGSAYRLGGDEFCVLVNQREMPPDSLLTACEHALSEQGEGFAITAAAGVVLLPEEARDAPGAGAQRQRRAARRSRRAAARVASRGHRARAGRRRPARHRQDRHPRPRPRQAGAADVRGMVVPPPPHAHRRADPEGGPRARARRPARALPPTSGWTATATRTGSRGKRSRSRRASSSSATRSTR